MKDSFDGEIHPMCEEDLTCPDEVLEVLTPAEAKFEQLRKQFEKRDQRREAFKKLR